MGCFPPFPGHPKSRDSTLPPSPARGTLKQDALNQRPEAAVLVDVRLHFGPGRLQVSQLPHCPAQSGGFCFRC